MFRRRPPAHSLHAGWRAAELPGGQSIWVWAAGPYAGEIGATIRRAKFGPDWVAAQALRRQLLGIHCSGIFTLRPTVVPIPSDPRRLGLRGLHLPVLLAKTVSRDHRLPLDRLGLLKPHASPSQAQSRPERLVTGPGSLRFEAHPRLSGRPVLLVDDVFTTGQTLDAAVEALNRVGSWPVGAVVLAHQARRTPGRSSHTKMTPCPSPNPPASPLFRLRSIFMWCWSSQKSLQTPET